MIHYIIALTKSLRIRVCDYFIIFLLAEKYTQDIG